jgi:hypothetical protein
MEVHELTDEEREQLVEKVCELMRIERRFLSRKELESEILDYLDKKQACTLATCGKEGAPRVSVVDYVNDGLTFYIFSEGGRKFQNLKENRRAAIGIGSSSKTFRSVRGINISGMADVFAEDTPEYVYAMKLFHPLFEDMEKEMGIPLKYPEGLTRIIRVTPTEIMYHHFNKGIFFAEWKTE